MSAAADRDRGARRGALSAMTGSRGGRAERGDRAALVARDGLGGRRRRASRCRFVPSRARTLAHENVRSPGTRTKTWSSSARRTTRVLMRSRGSMPRAAAASSRLEHAAVPGHRVLDARRERRRSTAGVRISPESLRSAVSSRSGSMPDSSRSYRAAAAGATGRCEAVVIEVTTSFDRMWADLEPVGRSARDGWLPPLRVDPDRPRPARVVRRRVRGAAGSTSSRTGRATSGRWWGDPDAARPGSSSARTSTASPTAAPSTARSASSAPSPPSTRCATAGVEPDRAARRRQLRRRGGRPLRRRLRRLPDHHRRPRRRPGPGADRRRRRLDGRGAGAAPGVTPRPLGPRRRDRARASAASSSCTSSRARPSRSRPTAATTSPTRPARSPSAPTSGRTAGGASTSPARPTTPAPPASRTVTTPCSASPTSSRPRGRMPWGSVAWPPSARSHVVPGGVNAIPSHVTGLARRAWCRASERRPRGRGRACRRRPRRLGATTSEESWTPTTTFDTRLVERLHGILPDAPLLGTGAGHDAGILATHGRADARCSSCATPQGSRTHRTSSRAPRTATMGSRPSPPS